MTISPLTSRLAALALLVAVPLVIWTLAVVPLLDGLARNQDSIAQSRLLLTRYRDLAAAAPLLERRRDALREANGTRAFLQGATPSMRAAALQAAAQRSVAAAGVLLRSSRTLPMAIEDGIERAGLELELAATAQDLTRLLYAFVAAEPVILVEKLVARVPENGAAPLASDGQPLMGVQMRLASFSQPVPGVAR